MLRQVATAASLVALGLLRDPGCSNVEDTNGGPNAPCTRSSDCSPGLSCLEGVCREPDAGVSAVEDAGRPDQASSSGDAGNDGG